MTRQESASEGAHDAAPETAGTGPTPPPLTDAPARLRFLAQAARLLASTLDPDDAIGELARLAVPTIADWCAIHLADDGGTVVRTEVAHRDPAMVEFAREYQRAHPPQGEGAVYRVINGADPLLIPEVTDAMLRDTARDAEHLETMRGLRMGSVMVVPLTARRRVLGALTLITGPDRRYGPADLRFAEDIAAQAALAVENARLYARATAEKARTETILRGVRDGIMVVDGDGRVVYANEIAARMNGFESAAEMLKVGVDELVDRFVLLDEDGDPIKREQLSGRRAMRGETDPEALIRWRLRGTDDERWTHVKSRAIQDAAGRRLVVSVLIDVTQRLEHEQRLKETQVELEEAWEAAQRASAAKSDFLAIVSHELRTPLNAITGFTELLLGGIYGEMPEAQREQLHRVDAAARHLTGLIEQILTFSRVDAGHVELSVEEVDVTALARGVAELMRPGATARGLDFQVELPDEPVKLQTDPARVRQILLNLLSNAIKFTEAGHVRLSLRRADDGGAELIAADSGVGISPGDLERIFEPFIQAEPASTRVRGGTGLGLTVSRSLARMLGGDLEVVSEHGAGSAFTLRLPPEPPDRQLES